MTAAPVSGAAARALAALRDDLSDPSLAVDSLMVVHGDDVVLEHWAEGCPPAAPHAVYSVTKTVTAIAAGIAVDEGLLDIDAPVRDVLGDLGAAIDARITVRHLLTMSSGRAAGDVRLSSLTSAEAVTAFVDLPELSAPGEVFAYCSLSSHLLGLAVARAQGSRLLPLLDERVFAPLGIATPAWETDRDGHQVGGSGLYLTTEDIARLGVLLRDRGSWRGRRIFSERWHEQATAAQIATDLPEEHRPEWAQGYGFQMWRGLHDVYRADGMLGQFAVIAPDVDLVVVTTARSAHTDRILAAIADRLLSPRVDIGVDRAVISVDTLGRTNEQSIAHLMATMPSTEARARRSL
ncbi:serine hydrolase domain-containing protein [Microbacterium sp. NPDC089695]|uniref:serine hydrolase domain-containing protein n=1 Tax=Microbacterium sp. NPDC089695 TaxID=3364198 RepID=UPI00380A03A8